MKSLFLIILITFITINSNSQDFCRINNFDFEKDIDFDQDGWQAIFDSFKLRYDTTDKAEGKRSIVFSRSFLKFDFNLCLYRKILLPKPVKQISVSVFSKSSLLQDAWLKICGFSKNGKIIVSDSISILNNINWKKNIARISSPNIYILSLEIRAREEFKEKKKEVKLWIDDIRVICEGENLSSLLAYNQNYQTKIKNITPLEDNMLLPQRVLSEIAKKKIIGFGETAHGSKESDKCIYDNARLLISQYGCRLLLFEMNIDLVAKYNLYINGLNVDTIYTPLAFLSSEHEKFIKWLKQFNSLNVNKVNIIGVDQHSNQLASDLFNSNRYVNSFLSSFNVKSNVLNELQYLVNYKKRIVPLKYCLNNENELSRLLNNFNFLVLKQMLLSRTDSALNFPRFQNVNYFYWQQIHRDYTLWQNTKAVIEKFSNNKVPVIIFAHFGHLDKVTSIHFNEVVTLGQYLNKLFGKDYFHIGVLLGEGQAGIMNNNKPVHFDLQYPIKGSLESLAMQANSNSFYKEGFVDSRIPLTIRRLGNTKAVCQFIPAYFDHSMDGFIFIRKSTPSF